MNVKAEDIKLSYGAEAILKGVSMEAGNREFVGLIWPQRKRKIHAFEVRLPRALPGQGSRFSGWKAFEGYELQDFRQKPGRGSPAQLLQF